MKIITVADVHLALFTSDKYDEKWHMPERLKNIIKSLDYIYKYAEKNNITQIDYLGDTFNDKVLVPTEAFKAFIEYIINRYPKISSVFIHGNHEGSDTTTGFSSCLEVLNQFPNIRTVINDVYISDDGKITYVPFSKTGMDLKIKDVKTPIMFSHFGLSEACLSSGLSLKTSITMNSLSHIPLTILGHYHKPQFIDGNNKCYYVGSPVGLNWNDKNEDKRFLVVDSETLEVESVPILAEVPKYIEYVINSQEDYEQYKEQAKLEKTNGNIVRIRNKCKDVVIEKTNNDDDIQMFDDITPELKDRNVNVTMSMDEKLKAYLTYKEIPEDKHDEYLKIIHRIIQ